MSVTHHSTTSSATAEQFCTFWVADLFFGVSVDEVQEVLRRQPMTPVPRADRAVTGSSQIVTCTNPRFSGSRTCRMMPV